MKEMRQRGKAQAATRMPKLLRTALATLPADTDGPIDEGAYPEISDEYLDAQQRHVDALKPENFKLTPITDTDGLVETDEIAELRSETPATKALWSLFKALDDRAATISRLTAENEAMREALESMLALRTISPAAAAEMRRLARQALASQEPRP